jgi:hypothetical protein
MVLWDWKNRPTLFEWGVFYNLKLLRNPETGHVHIASFVGRCCARPSDTQSASRCDFMLSIVDRQSSRDSGVSDIDAHRIRDRVCPVLHLNGPSATAGAGCLDQVRIDNAGFMFEHNVNVTRCAGGNGDAMNNRDTASGVHIANDSRGNSVEHTLKECPPVP